MSSEELNIDRINEVRCKSIADTIRPASVEELTALAERLFSYLDHPWQEPYLQFLQEHAGSSFFRATTNDGAEVVYCHDKSKGVWFVPGIGLGIIQEKGLAIMKEIVERPS